MIPPPLVVSPLTAQIVESLRHHICIIHESLAVNLILLVEIKEAAAQAQGWELLESQNTNINALGGRGGCQ